MLSARCRCRLNAGSLATACKRASSDASEEIVPMSPPTPASLPCFMNFFHHLGLGIEPVAQIGPLAPSALFPELVGPFGDLVPHAVGQLDRPLLIRRRQPGRRGTGS